MNLLISMTIKVANETPSLKESGGELAIYCIRGFCHENFPCTSLKTGCWCLNPNRQLIEEWQARRLPDGLPGVPKQSTPL
jgi:hypothetical protein